MSSENPAAPPAQNDESKGSSNTGDTNKSGDAKPKRVVNVPVCPPEVATAYLLVRAAMNGVLGCQVDQAPCKPMQATYVKEKVMSGKFSMSLGKKLGTSCQIELPEEKEKHNIVFDSIESAVNRMVQEGLDIELFSLPRPKLMETYGSTVFDEGNLKAKKGQEEQVMPLGFIKGVVCAIPPGTQLYKNTSALGTVVLERGNLTSALNCGKKARKADITLKFRVDPPAEATTVPLAESGDAAAAPSLEDLASMFSMNIRMAEGEALIAKLDEQSAQKEAPASASPTKTADTEKLPPPSESTEPVKASPPQEDQAQKEQDDDGEMVVNAFEVKGKIDYNKLVDQFGSKLVDESLMAKLERLTVGRGKVSHIHRFLRRGMFFSHRDLDKFLDCVEKGQPVYLYTGRGPSSEAMHLGHLIPFLFTQWLQQAFGCPLVIQMTDDEKFLFKGTYDEETGDNLEYFQGLTMENARDILACGFDPEKTFIFSDVEYVGQMYANVVRIWKAVTTNTIFNIFGFDMSANMGKVAYPAIQAAPSFPSSFPTVLQANRSSEMACLIPCAIDQDPYFRMTRDLAHKLVPKSHPLGGKPALFHSKFFPPLQGATGKMSSSDQNSAIFLTDTPEEIEKKIKEHAFSGGQETKKLQELHGADLDMDVSYQWLRFFLEDDDELARIGADYGSGSGEYWSTGKVKQKLIDVLKDLVASHQERRAQMTDEKVREIMKERSIV